MSVKNKVEEFKSGHEKVSVELLRELIEHINNNKYGIDLDYSDWEENDSAYRMLTED